MADRRPDHKLLIGKIDVEGAEHDPVASGTEPGEEGSRRPDQASPHDLNLPDQDTSRHLEETIGLPSHTLPSEGENLIYVRHARGSQLN